jgi:PAS domain S-box-containing protein
MRLGIAGVEDYDKKNLLAFTPLHLPAQTWTMVVRHTPHNVTLLLQQATARRWFYMLAMVGTVLAMTLWLMVMTRRSYRREMQVWHDGERALRESEERYRHLVELSPDAIYVHNGESFIYANPAGAALLGAGAPAQLLGRSLADVVRMDDQDGDAERVRWLSQVQEEHPLFEIRLRRVDGQPIDVEVVSTPIVYDCRAAAQVIVRDTTRRKQITAELARDAKELVRSNLDLGQFAYVASHDLQEPLRKVVSFTDLLAKHYDGRLDAEAETFMGYITDGATRMQLLIRDLLAYSRVDRGGGGFEPTDLDTILKATLATLDLSIQEQRAEITATPLPQVLSQPGLMRQLFQNLIGNALKFHGAEPPRIHITAEQRGETWYFAIRDNGIGLEPQYAERIFVIFQRLHSRTAYAGTGIGLAICQKIVDRHGGRIWIESELGQGTTFYFTLPVSGASKTVTEANAKIKETSL